MSTHSHPPQSEIPYGPEERDANIPLIVWTGAGILFTVVLCMVIVLFQYRFEMSVLPTKAAGPFPNANRTPPEPRLQAFPARDLQEFKAGQLHKLESYGWADKQGGIAHIPVEQAMETILKNGLPVVLAKPEGMAKTQPKPEAKKQ